METRTYNGKTYYEETVVQSRSSNELVVNQNPTTYLGFDFFQKRGQDWSANPGANNVDYWHEDSDGDGNDNEYHLNFLYSRKKYKISYFDGNYVDGNDVRIQNRAGHLLFESPTIHHGSTIPQRYSDTVPPLPAGQKGYVFEGWFVDAGCTTPRVWGKMPVGDITVYAKWRQIQYRVFLHPNAGTDETLDWGSENQAMNFRVSYGGTVSLPTGSRTGYEFVGWYVSTKLKTSYSKKTKLNETYKYFSAYDKTVHMTDSMDKWGNITNPPGSNSDLTGNNGGDRYWITQEVNLYAKWRKVIEGA